MTADDFRQRLRQLFPTLEAFLASSFFSPDDSPYTPHRLCSEFTTFYLQHVDDYDAPEIIELFRLIEVIVVADPFDRDPLANAVLTCFLENISYTRAGEAGRVHMGSASAAFFAGWHGPPPYQR